MHPPSPTPKTIGLTTLAMIAFAANSLLCRMALGEGMIDAASFTLIRLGSGALVLLPLLALARRAPTPARRDWIAPVAMSVYMICFSFAFLSLGAGTGALILAGSIQMTMLIAGLRSGERLRPAGWVGLGLAATGLILLVAPGASAPPLGSALLMTSAGIAWGVYSLHGRGNTDPLRATATSFLLAFPLAALAGLPFLSDVSLSVVGVGLAVVSGAVASALGYVIWYHALPGLTATTAATVQLSISVLAATGGAFLFSEALTTRLIGSSAAVLGGLALVFRQQGAERSPAPIQEGRTQPRRSGPREGRTRPRRPPPRRSSTAALRPTPIG
jgi:drug/metabolite transporter (DMT)-like permease